MNSLFELITGNVGEGKTLLQVEHCHNVHLQNLYLNERVSFYKWCPIYCNFEVKYEEAVRIDVDDLLGLEGIHFGFMPIDEGYTWLESRVSASKMNRYVSYFMFQSRKRGVDVSVSAQLGSSIDLRFVDLAHGQVFSRNDRPNFRFRYYGGWRVGAGVRFVTDDLFYEKAKKFWNDYKTDEPVKPLGVEELQVEMERLNPIKLNRRVDGICHLFLDDSIKSALCWRSDKDVYKFQVEDLMVRWGLPVVLAPLVVNRVKSYLRCS